MHLLAEAHRAWERMRPLREKRERNKNFTYGNQWCDMMTDEHGQRVSEWQHLRDNGKDPLTNNLIRQLVKSVVGRFRSRLAAEPAPAEPLHGNLVGELDSRLMEEFLISGCCFQRIDFGEEGRVALSNVSPSQMLFRGGDDRPEQVSGNATNIGAYEMVNLQMRLFEQISGVSGALQGQASAGTTGAQLYESQVSNSTIALGDIFETFDSFRRERDRKAAKVRDVKKL